MESLIQRQSEILEQLKQIKSNFSKDSSSRKTADYLMKRLSALDSLWGEFSMNNEQLQLCENKEQKYFLENIFDQAKQFYINLRHTISSYKTEEKHTVDKAIQDGRVNELLNQQRTNFRAFNRLVQSIVPSEISEKWELEDELRNLQLKWSIIDNMHLQIDNLLQGEDTFYEQEFISYENTFKQMKRSLNKKLSNSTHAQQATPVIDIPIFTGKYSQWPTFFDLFTETIHNSNTLSRTQKMQHLKCKVKGDAERIIQHLNVTSENYDTAWELLTHRYNNPQVLFTMQIETFLNQPSVHKQTSFELKKLYDTSTECIHAIHNLGIDTNTWDPLLVHLLAKKLDSATYSDYKESRKSPRDLPTLEEFMSFLEAKFIALEPINRERKDREVLPAPTRHNYHHQGYQKPIATWNNKQSRFYSSYKAAPTYTSSLKCPLCKQDHHLFRCHKFLNLSAEAKMRTIVKYQICQNCLFKHNEKCRSTKRCKECNGEHNTLLHDACRQAMTSPSNIPSHASTTMSPVPSTSKQLNVNHVAAENEEVLLTTILLKVRAADGSYLVLRALLDQGSQITLISENAAQMLGLPRKQYHASVSGIGTGSKYSKGVVSLDCLSIYNDYNFTTQALVITRVINNLPNSTFSKQQWPHLQHVSLADPEYNISRPIDLLLDASVYSEIIMSGLIKGPIQAPIAQQTKLGWILSGNVNKFQCNVVINNIEEISKFWEMEDITSNTNNLTREEQYCEDFYQATTKRLSDGRYEVALPMKNGFEEKLGESKQKAIAQFKQLETKMKKQHDFSEEYKSFLEEYQQLGHMIPSQPNSSPCFYLPHHGVLKLDSSTTKLRVVFNGSSKTSSGQSLNDLMECGPNLQVDLQDLILRWRNHKYVITADIEKMFRQILVRAEDQPLQSIIWRNTPDEPLREYQLTTVTYGTKAAPYLAIRTLRQLAKDDASKYPLAAQALENSFFTDDLLCGHQTLELTKVLQRQLIDILKGAGMNLRKWSANNNELVTDLDSNQIDTPFQFKCSNSRKTLGLQWQPATDTFTFQNKLDCDKQCNTKRQLLSDISKVFDPLGWISPVTVKAKFLFQRAWSSGTSWDSNLPLQIQNEWEQLRSDFKNINNISIPRYIGNIQGAYQIHGFCDASEKAFACVVYIVTQNDKGEFTPVLVTAKTRLAPLNKEISLPRLELCGALLLAQLISKVKNSYKLANDLHNTYAWTDSMVVLGWIHGDISRWKQFVANRVSQISKIVPASQWGHVKSEENPADCASRGLTVTSLLEHNLWWQGPEWITKHKSSFNQSEYQQPTIELKKSKSSVNAALCEQKLTLIDKLLAENNSITKTVRLIAWISRFVAQLRNRSGNINNYLLSSELNEAYFTIIKHIQAYEFETDLINLKNKGHVKHKSKIAALHPFLDEHGIIRVGGRLNYSNLNSSAKHPAILSSHSRFTDLIIEQAHLTTLHGGPRLTLSFIREKYWIVSGMRTVKRILRKCVKCRRFSSENKQQIMADLPQPRVTPSRPFTHTGVDFTGHVDLKISKGRGIRCSKGYVSVFVCLSTKAVHLELVSDLSTPAFLAAFRRFCSRRGTPKHMYSDNGTNFVGANRLLKREYSEIVRNINEEFFNSISEWDIKWSFNSPAWPSAGGLWEAAVKSFKYHLKRVLGDQKITYEEFTTLLYQIEAALNSRPLLALTENPEDEFLTPGHFLVGGSLLSRPQGDDEHLSLPLRWQLIQTMMKHFWKKWSADYLNQLQARTKWRTPTKNLELNDIVLIKEDNIPPGKWALGRVQEIHPGKDGYVRVVSLKTQNKIIKRPISKLITLPVHEDHQPSTQHQYSQHQHNHQGSIQHSSKVRPRRISKTSKGFFNFATILLCLSVFITPTVQQDPNTLNVTQLNADTGLYFDKMSNLQHIRDEWKVVIYYNLKNYYKSIFDIKAYIDHLSSYCTEDMTQYQVIIRQLEHELNEIQHYNKILQNQQLTRQKRGLINGVGYVANSLFGILDQGFAEKYSQDIEKISLNENHLQQLIRNQTIVLEAESNIIQRNEKIMNSQFQFINQHVQNLTVEVGKVSYEARTGLYITSSALTASMVLNNIKRIQETLINTVTDIRHGRVDTHLLSPEQLQLQLSIISSRLQDDLTVPVEKTQLNELYKTLKIASAMHQGYLIIEIKVPIISKETFELDKIVTVPVQKGSRTILTIPQHQYIAFNLRGDTASFLSQDDINSCLQLQNHRLLCSFNSPIYHLKLKETICQAKINHVIANKTICTYLQTPCENTWIKLHQHNKWIYSCCQECSVRIFCPGSILMKSLTGSGLITLGQGCVLKTNDLSIYAHNNYINHMTLNTNIEVPEISILNKILNTSLSDNYEEENHTDVWEKLNKQIQSVKEQSYSDLSIHDIHHYTALYVTIAIVIAIGVFVVWFRMLKGCRKASPTQSPPEEPLQHLQLSSVPGSAQANSGSVSEIVNTTFMSNECGRLCKSMSNISADKCTSPVVSRSVSFQVPNTDSLTRSTVNNKTINHY